MSDKETKGPIPVDRTVRLVEAARDWAKKRLAVMRAIDTECEMQLPSGTLTRQADAEYQEAMSALIAAVADHDGVPISALLLLNS